MKNGVWFLLRRFVRRHRRTPATRPPARSPEIRRPLLAVMLIGFLSAGAMISALELRLRPVVEALAAHQISNRITAEINAELGQLGADYGTLAEISRDEAGTITAITTDMAQANLLRARVVDSVLDAISAVNVSTLGVPLGSLFDLDLLWAKGPVIRVRSLTAGTVSAQLKSEFRAAGINQTLHRVLLEVTVPLNVLLTGGRVAAEVNTTVCLAETVIVGRVPQTYLDGGTLRDAE